MPNNKLYANSPASHRGYDPTRLQVSGYSVSRSGEAARQFESYREATKACLALNNDVRCELGLWWNDPIPPEKRWRVIPQTRSLIQDKLFSRLPLPDQEEPEDEDYA